MNGNMLPQVGAHYMQQSSQSAASSKDSSNQQVFIFPFVTISVCLTFTHFLFFSFSLPYLLRFCSVLSHTAICNSLSSIYISYICFMLLLYKECMYAFHGFKSEFSFLVEL